MLVPSKGANGEPANSGSVDERISPPGAARSGFSRCPNAVGPAEEKLVTTPDLPFFASSGLKLKRTLARPPTEARKSRR